MATACSPPVVDEPPPPPVDEPQPLEIAFDDCRILAGAADERTQCAVVDVPLDRESDAGTISLFVKRVRATSGTAQRRMFLLMGGPGQPGSDGEGLAKVMADEDEDLEVVVADHRGTGSSTRLTCENEEDEASSSGAFVDETELAGCITALTDEWGDVGLASFNATEAARDVVDLADGLDALDADEGAIERVPTFLLGISYGTYLANRILQVAPERFDGTIFDSMCPPGVCVFNEADVTEDVENEAIFALCADDPDCAPRFENGDAWAALEQLMIDIDGGHCLLTENAADMRELTRVLLGVMMTDAGLRRAGPAVVHRLTRCTDDDKEAIANLIGLLFGPPGAVTPFTGFSFPLSNNIAVSEMWDPNGTQPDDVQATTATLHATRSVSSNLAEAVRVWPTYDEPLKNTFATTTKPVLILNAEHDPITPISYAEEYAANFTGEDQTLVEIQGSAHSTVGQGIILSLPGQTCGRILAHQFLEAPTVGLDTSCTELTVPLAFSGSTQFALTLFGETDIWGDDEAP